HASQGLELARKVGGPAFTAFLQAQLGWVAAARGDLEEVGRRTEELELLIRDTGSRGIWKETLLLRAFLAMETDRERLPGLLGEAFGLARRSHGLAPYLWHRPLLTRLCAEALEAGIETDYVRDLIRRFRLEADPSLAEYEAWPRPLRIYVLGSLRILRDGEAVRFTGKAQKRPLELLTAL
ncbi:MAG: hypothetical protein GWN36_17685, partial [Gemmatimonadetes bacterium]|nr:hypothetical protein [Gemmatimonadota bacterium]